MSVISDRVSAAIDRVGQDLAFTTLAGGAGAFTVRGLIGPFSAGVWLDNVEVMAVTYPAFFAVFKHNSGVVVDDDFTVSGRAVTVLKAFSVRIGTEVVCVQACCG